MAPVAEAIALLEALKDQVGAVREHVRGLLRRLRGGELPTHKAGGALGLRLPLLSLYVGDLGRLLGTKVRGRSLREEPALERLLETRVALSRLGPLEQRLRQLLERLRPGGRGPADPLRFRPSPTNMAAQEEEEEEGGGGAKAPGLGGGRGKYVPPHILPVQWEAVGRRRGAEEASRRRALTGSVLRELRDELSSAPQEVWGGAAGGPPTHGERQRRRLEEALLLRLKGAGPRRGAGPDPRGAELDTITHFRPLGPLLEPANQEAPPPKRRKKKATNQKRGRRKGFRRRR